MSVEEPRPPADPPDRYNVVRDVLGSWPTTIRFLVVFVVVAAGTGLLLSALGPGWAYPLAAVAGVISGGGAARTLRPRAPT